MYLRICICLNYYLKISYTLKKNFKIFIKLHPAITKLYFNKFFKNHLKGFNYQLIESKKSQIYIYLIKI